MDDHVNLQALSCEVQNSLRREQEQFPLIGPAVAFAASSVAETIRWNELLVKKSTWLFPSPASAPGTGPSRRYASIREVRRDGNCFIRSVVFRAMELQLNRPDLASKSQAFVDAISPVLCAMFSEYAQDFCDVYRELLEKIRVGQVKTSAELHREVCNPEQSEYLICFFRYVISSYIRTHEDFFLPYIVDFSSVAEYCSSEVEAVSKECEQIHAAALSNAMNLPIVVQYLDLSPSDKPDEHVIEPAVIASGDVLPEMPLPEGEAAHLLYRPGHFDVLYPVASPS
jgi:ubiquitin thioesterase protein OTUB1